MSAFFDFKYCMSEFDTVLGLRVFSSVLSVLVDRYYQVQHLFFSARSRQRLQQVDCELRSADIDPVERDGLHDPAWFRPLTGSKGLDVKTS